MSKKGCFCCFCYYFCFPFFLLLLLFSNVSSPKKFSPLANDILTFPLCRDSLIVASFSFALDRYGLAPRLPGLHRRLDMIGMMEMANDNVMVCGVEIPTFLYTLLVTQSTCNEI